MSSLVSEMRIDNDGTASFYLDRERMARDGRFGSRSELQLRRASEVLKQWQGRERLIAMLDMTTPGDGGGAPQGRFAEAGETRLPSWRTLTR